MSEPSIIHTGTFDEGFEVGWQAVRGTMAMSPMSPMAPMTRMNSTDFLMGVRKGMERALGKSLDDLR